MNIKKHFKSIVSILCAAVMASGLALSVSAKTIDLDFDSSQIPVLDPWVSFSFGMDHYDTTKFTDETEVIVEFSYEFKPGENDIPEEEETYRSECPIELIVQSWSNPDTPMVNATGGVWAKTAPYEWENGVAKFSMADMIAAYGTSDFSGVDALNIGATGHAVITVTSFKITSCQDDIYIEMTDAERAEAYKNALIAVLASALAIIVIIIIVFMIILKRKTSYAYDAATGKYIKMK